jgi:hypothetical protein
MFSYKTDSLRATSPAWRGLATIQLAAFRASGGRSPAKATAHRPPASGANPALLTPSCPRARISVVASVFCLAAIALQLAGTLPAVADTTTTTIAGSPQEKDPGSATTTMATTTLPTTTIVSTTVPPATTSTTTTTPMTSTTTGATTTEQVATTSPASPAPVSPPSVAAQGDLPTGASSSTPGVGPAAPSASTGRSFGAGAEFRSSQILQLLEAAAARRANLEVHIAERESALARVESERARAQAALDAGRAEEESLRARLAATRAELQVVQEVLRRPPATSVEPNRLRTLPSSALHELRVDQVAVAGPAPRQVRSTPAHGKTLHRQAELVRTATTQEEEVIRARRRTATAEQAAVTKADEVAAVRHSLDEVREQLWSTVRDDPALRQARALTTAADGQVATPTAFALADIPSHYLDLYRRSAATCPGLSWTVVAAIGSVESAHGRSTAPGVGSGSNFAGAMGPMQFLAETWAAYGVDADGDGRPNVYAPEDAVFGAANYLCASRAGSLAHLSEAVWAYNHADWYPTTSLRLPCATASTGSASAKPPPMYGPSSSTRTSRSARTLGPTLSLASPIPGW